MNYRNILILIFVITSIIAYSQISGGDTPESFNFTIENEIPVVSMSDNQPEVREIFDKVPDQAGYTLPFNNDLQNVGIWERHEDIYFWRLEIVVPDAKAVNLYIRFKETHSESRLFLYSPDRLTLRKIQILQNSNICTDFIPGERLVIEYNSKYRSELPFSITEAGVLNDYTAFSARGFGDAGSCEVHINCPEGNNWQNEKSGIARILVKQGNKTFWCTGTLLNNTRNDGTPLFLTANHCGESSDSTDYSEWLFYFNFESSNCNQPDFEPEYNTISGSTLLANSPPGTNIGSDFKLLLLNQYIPENYKVYYNGWNRSGNVSPNGVTIHHPEGDVKMISTYSDQLTSTKYNSTIEDPDGMYWQVYWSETQSGHGVTEKGSSGSPIFDNEGNVIGSLTGGGASCTFQNEPDYYGKLSSSWGTTSRDSTSGLYYWLDPIGTGTQILHGTNLDSTNIIAGFSSDATSIVLGESVTFSNTSYGNVNGYKWYFEGGNPEFSELKEPGEIIYAESGDFDVQLIVFSGDNSDTLLRKDYLTVTPNISPNPCVNTVKLSFGSDVPEDYEIIINDFVGNDIGYVIKETGSNYLIIDMSTVSKGTYLVRFMSSQINQTYKVVVIGN